MLKRLNGTRVAAVSLALLVAGTSVSVWAADSGKEILKAVQSTIAQEGQKLAEALVSVRVDGLLKDAKPIRTYGGMRPPKNRHAMAGTILTSEGHVLIPVELDPDKLEHLTVWMNDEKLEATFLAASDKLNMSLIQIETEKKLSHVNLEKGADAKVGECLISVTPTGEETDFEKYTTMGFNRGVKSAGRYRQFLTGFMDPGVAAVNLDGHLVGIVQNRKLLAIRDLSSDIRKLLKKAKEKEAAGDEVAQKNDPKDQEKNKDKKPWLGVLLTPINEDLAQSLGYPKGAIWFTAVMSDSAAAKAGLKAQDLAIEVNGRPVKKTSANALAHFHKLLDPELGEPFTLKVMRENKEVHIKGTFGPRPEPKELKADDIGVEVQACTDADYYMKNLFTRAGVLVKSIRPGSPAAVSANFRSSMISVNDVIIKFDGHKIENLDDFKKALSQFRKRKVDFVLLKVFRGNRIYTVGLNMKIGEEKPKGT